MPTIDTHCHVSPVWYEPVESLLFQLDRNGVDRAVMIQLNSQFNNEYQFDCVRRHPDRLASVVLVDATRADAGDTLARLVERGAVGVRLAPDTRSPGADPLALWRRAEALGIAVSSGGSAGAFAEPAFADVIAAVPGLPIVIEHMGSVSRPDGEDAPYAVRARVFALSRFPNVYLKVHGLGEFCRRARPFDPEPFDRATLPILDLALAAFGPSRMMWGSDYPPVSGREGYTNALNRTRAEVESRAPAGVAQVFGGTAERVFKLRGR